MYKTCKITYPLSKSGKLVEELFADYINEGGSERYDDDTCEWEVDLPSDFADSMMKRFADGKDGVKMKVYN